MQWSRTLWLGNYGEHTGTGQRETQTISTHGGEWGTGGHNWESGKTIRLVTHEEGQVT